MPFNVLARGKKSDIDLPGLPGNTMNVRQMFGFPQTARRVRLQVWRAQGPPVEFYHGLPDENNRDAGRVYVPYGIVEVIPDADGGVFAIGTGTIDVSPLGYWT